MATKGSPAAGYKFNTFQEIKSHSSVLFNERMAILFYWLDMKSINMNTNYAIQDVLEVKGILKQIYKNIRTLIRNNPAMRATLNLETRDPGIYITDYALANIDRMVEFCERQSYTIKRIYIIANELNRIETIIKDVLQYYNYFIRPDFKQKPDIEIATEKYKQIVDKKTVEELRSIVGKNNKIDFEDLGTTRVERINDIEYDENVDGPKSHEDNYFLMGLDDEDYDE